MATVSGYSGRHAATILVFCIGDTARPAVAALEFSLGGAGSRPGKGPDPLHLQDLRVTAGLPVSNPGNFPIQARRQDQDQQGLPTCPAGKIHERQQRCCRLLAQPAGGLNQAQILLHHGAA